MCLQWFSVKGSKGSLPALFGGKILTGLPLGVFVTVAPPYCTEIAPLKIRGAVTSAVAFNITLGQLLAYGVMRQTAALPGSQSYRTIFAVQWGFACVGLLILPFFPESPYYFVRKGQLDKARATIRRLCPRGFPVDGWIESIQANVKREKREASWIASGNTISSGLWLL